MHYHRSAERFERAWSVGFRYPYADHEPDAGTGIAPSTPYVPKPGSHGDGPLGGMFFGGIGGSAFSRGIDGGFDRWHLEPGRRYAGRIDAAFLMVRWESEGRVGYARLDGKLAGRHLDGQAVGAPLARRYAALFPEAFEYYDLPGLPFSILVEAFSPVIPGDYEASALPVALFDIRFVSRASAPVSVSAGLVWPNLLGWRLPYRATESSRESAWPDLSNWGNSARLWSSEPGGCVVAQTREAPVACRERAAGSVAIAARAPGWEASYASCFRATQLNTGVPDDRQAYTLASIERSFAESGRLPDDDTRWTAHGREALASAVALSGVLAPDSEGLASFCLAFDVPRFEFGGGRAWTRKYAVPPPGPELAVGRGRGDGGPAGRELEPGLGLDPGRAAAMAADALDRREAWLERISAWHGASLSEFGVAEAGVAGARINDLYYLSAGGSVWAAPDSEAADSCDAGDANDANDAGWRGRDIRFGLLEGFDTGYYYYNTLDLWVYAFAALSLNWPALAENVFAGFIESASRPKGALRMVYRTGTMEPLTIPGVLPHDMGCPSEDPWFAVNAYHHRDDPNLWKDRAPAFIAAFYAHRALTDRPVSADEYRALEAIAATIEAQAGPGNGAPRHDAFGDSTWDNLEMRGISAYTAGLCSAAWATMAALARVHEPGQELKYGRLRAAAIDAMDSLWNGAYFKINDEGKYRDAAMADALFGALIARRSGLGDIVPFEKAKSHLLAVVEHNWKRYAGGRVGPLLVAEPGQTSYSQDGGEELQVNEVIVGSAWLCAAALREYGLDEEASSLAATLADVLYRGSGLQFGTPAAWDGDGRFRAPLNMRPLASWLYEPRRSGRN